MRWVVLCVASGLALITVGVVGSAPVYANPPQPNITICHATSSDENPYNQITVDADSIIKEHGHGSHVGPIYPTPGWGDIIPPFDYPNDTGGTSHYPGLNWSGHGQAISHGGCLVDFVPIKPPEETTTTSTTAPTTTTSVPPITSAPTTPTTSAPTTPTTPAPTTPTTPPGTSSPTTTTLPTTTLPIAPTVPGVTTAPTTPGASTTAVPGGSTTLPGATTLPGSTTVPGATPTTIPAEVPNTPPTTAPASERPPPLVDPPDGAEIMPPEEAVTIDPPSSTTPLPGATTTTLLPGAGDVTVDLGPLTPSERVTLEEEVDAATTPVPSGAPQAGLGGASASNGPSAGWIAVGVLLVFAGVVSLGLWRRRRA